MGRKKNSYGSRLHRPEPEFGYTEDIIEDIQRSICPYEYTFRRSEQKLKNNNNDNDIWLTIDVSKFDISEIKIKIYKNFLIIEGKHGEKNDGFGTIERHFIRKLKIPKGINKEAIEGIFSSNGILTIKSKMIHNHLT
ncbi:Protein lethal(2)essential for life [Strongyloides ratti]|uniref:Protein lethal(2)essential for life n=1 Tax=Strongyloides ratti TaxID=34506 RepID=A0A090MUB7_STRRB|nr:Protein lethal(2)essential for life [Strongyloides ratti]CEF62133.1 Protein lethal(2)essential for life [Strongyloides ratti]